MVLSECVDQAQRTPSQKKGAGGVILPQHKRRQLYDNTTEELHTLGLGLGADLGQGHLGKTLSISRRGVDRLDVDRPDVDKTQDSASTRPGHKVDTVGRMSTWENI